MYFNNKGSTNIDNEFKKNNFFTNVFSFVNKYKIIFIVFIIIIICIISIHFFIPNTDNNYLVLNGDEVITIYQGSDYIEPGYKAYNSKNKDLTNEVKIDSNLNVKLVGEYEISYKIGNVVKNRKIVVIEKPKVYTFIKLNVVDNKIDVYLEVGEEYKEPGYQVFSSTGKNLNDKVKVTGNVDTSKKGKYEIKYTLVDEDGVTIMVSRIVTVMDTEISLSLNTSSYTNKDVGININIDDEFFDYLLLPDGSKIKQNNYMYMVSSNGKYTFKAYSTKGMVKEKSIEVNNIDNILPTGSCSGSYKNGKSTINVNAKDNIGIKKYEIEGSSYTNNKITINKELSSITIKIYDKAGNIKNISCSLKNDNPPATYYKREFSVNNFALKNGLELAYWLYIPEGATDNMPLVIYLHGTEGKGNDFKNKTKKAITYGPGSDIYNNRREFNAIILMPQARYKQEIYGNELMELIEYIVNKYKINKKKVSLVGMSEGGYHIGSNVADYADYFSAIVFLATYPSNPEKFLNMPILSVCGENDYERINTMIYFSKRVNELGGNAKHYTLPGLGHTIVDNNGYSVFRDEKYDLVDWMIKQTKK